MRWRFLKMRSKSYKDKSLSIARNLEIGDKVLLGWTHRWHDVLDICECYERSYDLVSCNNCPGRIYFSDHEDDDLCYGCNTRSEEHTSELSHHDLVCRLL